MADKEKIFLHEFDANGDPIDILYSSRRTIGQTLGQSTHKTGQRYALDTDGITEIHVKGETIDDSPYTAPLTIFDGTHQGGAFSAFEEAASFVDGQKIISIQNSFSDHGEIPNIKLIKGKEKLNYENSISFNQLLNDMNDPKGKIAQGVSQNLMKDNGYDNDHQYKDSVDKSIPIQTKFGTYEKTDTRFEVTLADYKNLGFQLLFQGSGELKKITNPTSDAEQAEFLLASPLAKARMGVKVASNDLYPSKILKQEQPEFSKDPNSQYYGNPGYVNGAPYNPLIVFEGFSNGAQTSMCYLLFTALFTTITTVAATYEAMSNKEQTKQSAQNFARNIGISRLFGQSQNQTAGSDNFFGLVDTKYDYTNCVRRGLRAFFGFGADGSIANASMFINNPGYSATILRMIVSNTTEIFGNSVLGSVIPGGIPANTSAPSSVIQSLGSASDTLNKLRNSKLLKFMNVVAHIGDIILYLEDAGYDTTLYAGDVGHVTILPTSEIVHGVAPDQDILNLRNAPINNRLLTQYGSGLSWATKTTPNAINYTSTFHKARQYFVGNINSKTNAAFIDTISKQTPEIYGAAKLSQDYVQKVEQQLGYAYLPFYFHDLRTNEIISFHGFLSDLNDSHSTEYETTEGYGRAGVIHHYKNIKRKTSLRFWMVATSKEDFDLMWFKLNKLIAMSQPLYTAGRQVSYTSEDNKLYKFTQPFSQIPAATPIVRVRVGDIITNNHSELDVARLFGLGSDDSFGVGIDTQPTDQRVTDTTNEANLALTNRQSIASILELTAGKEIAINQTLYGIPARRTGANGTITNTQPTRPTRGLQTFESGQKLTIVTVNPAVNGLRTIIVKPATSTAKYEMTDTLIFGTCSETVDVILQRQAALDNNMSQTTQTIQQQRSQENSVQQNPNGVNEVDSWLRNSPIFKSFESASGEGMLAVIESIDPQFDVTSMTWEDEPGSVAPKAFEVSVALSPMYDINPGIAADGQMIGALYRPGRINHGIKALKYPSDKYQLNQPSAEGTAAPSGQPPSSNPAYNSR